MTNCPLDDDFFDADAEDYICNECFLNSEDYQELISLHPLTQVALDYLGRQELALSDSPDSYTYKEQSAILIVHQELNRLQREEHRKKREEAETKQGRERKGIEVIGKDPSEWQGQIPKSP